MEIVLVAAVARNGVIGVGGGLPWRLSTDMKRFKALTMGKPIVMGRKTFESIGRPLPGRANIIISRNPQLRVDGADVVGNLSDALVLAGARGRCLPAGGEVCIVGGGEIYRQAMPVADRLEITHVLADAEGDVQFPLIDAAEWQLVSEQTIAQGPRDSALMRFASYRRHAGDGLKAVTSR